jgi:hypothetical protein
VQKIGWIVAIMCGLSWWAVEMPLPGDALSPPEKTENLWRRTVNGWEKTNQWILPPDRPPPVFHPEFLGLLMILIPATAGMITVERHSGGQISNLSKR